MGLVVLDVPRGEGGIAVLLQARVARDERPEVRLGVRLPIRIAHALVGRIHVAGLDLGELRPHRLDRAASGEDREPADEADENEDEREATAAAEAYPEDGGASLLGRERRRGHGRDG
ncbi:MAG: hypothetical protein E6G48_09470 [Actinobacteria bacterium]|nr:MAG: hypothetical protein E6G48_09470 [Actinomycetota bacterium]